MGEAPIRIFVAMPFSTMGTSAAWADVQEIRRELFDVVARRLAELLDRPTDLVIEDEKKVSAPIHDSMFAEALAADVYIADLSGNNANVFLELGVRWASRDGVTILVTQDIDDHPKFNVGGNRIIPYGSRPGELRSAVTDIVAAAAFGLRDPGHIDSPVRRNSERITIARAELDGLREEIARLRDEQAEEIIELARRSPQDAVEILSRAVRHSPTNHRAHFELGRALAGSATSTEDYSRSAAAFRTATRLRPDSGAAWRELGVVLGKGGQLTEAAEALRKAVSLSPDDHEAWSNLGGQLRRQARRGDGDFDTVLLRQSRDAYRKAIELNGNDTYPRLNEARITLLLAGDKTVERAAARAYFERLEGLARFTVKELRANATTTGRASADLPWKLLDLADCLIFSGRGEEGLETVRAAVNEIPTANRASYLDSAIGPWRDALAAGILEQTETRFVTQAIDIAEQAAARSY